MSTFIDFFMSESFENKFNDPYDRLIECKNWCADQWESDNDSAGYPADFNAWTLVIPESSLPYDPNNNNLLEERRIAANDWLEENWYYWDTMAAAIVLDDIDEIDDRVGQASVGGAFRDYRMTGHIDMAYERNNSLSFSTPIDNVAYHELGHVFNCDGDHSQGRTYSTGNCTVMALPDQYACGTQYSEPHNRYDWYSSCARSTIRDHIDEYS